jgi:hypothetical protein
LSQPEQSCAPNPILRLIDLCELEEAQMLRKSRFIPFQTGAAILHQSDEANFLEMVDQTAMAGQI